MMNLEDLAKKKRFIVDMRVPLHTVFRVTLKNKEVYALDMTGPQFGWYGPTVTPWSTFISSKVDIIKAVHEFGAMAPTLKADAQAAEVPRINIEHINE